MKDENLDTWEELQKFFTLFQKMDLGLSKRSKGMVEDESLN
jgi:hypothetical protein